jgi:hypothetical protein
MPTSEDTNDSVYSLEPGDNAQEPKSYRMNLCIKSPAVMTAMVLCSYGEKGDMFLTHKESLLKGPLRLNSPTKNRDSHIEGWL